MSQNVTEVFRVTVPSVGLVFKARADITGRREAFARRIGDDSPGDADALLTEYSASRDCVFNFAGGDTGQDMVFAAGGKAVKAAPVFFETRYFFRGDIQPPDGRAVRDVVVDHRMESVAEAFNYDDGTLVGTLDFINEPGRFRLDLRIVFDDGSSETVRLEFMVVSVKMNVARDYEQIVKAIDSERPNIVRAFLSKTFWRAALDRDGEPDDCGWYDILVEVFDYYESAVRRIVSNPHRRYLATDDWRRADRVRRWTPPLANRYNRMDDDRRCHELFRTERLVAESDTPENRFVLHTLKELCQRLEAFGERLKGVAGVSQGWKDGVASRVLALGRLARHPFFRGVSRFSGFRQQSLVLQKSAGYAQILTAWLKLRSALRPGGDDVDVGYRPISTLYEFWCFLKIRDMVAAADSPFRCADPVPRIGNVESWGEILDDRDEARPSGKLGKIEYEFNEADGGGRRLLLTYQQSYRAEEAGAFAYLNPQRPDIVLTIKDTALPDGAGEYAYIFDAKYRIRPSGGDAPDETTTEAIDAMHQYRDAILYRRQKDDRHLSRAVIGAYVLYPGRPLPKSFDYSKVIDAENIGAIPLLPGEEGCGELRKFIAGILGRKTADAHLGVKGDGYLNVIPTRGTTVVVGRGFSEESIPTIELNGDRWPRWSDAFIGVPIDQARKMPRELPALVRLQCNNKPELIVKVLHEHSREPQIVSYKVMWTESGGVTP